MLAEASVELQLERGNGGMWLHVAEAHLEGAGWWWWWLWWWGDVRWWWWWGGGGGGEGGGLAEAAGGGGLLHMAHLVHAPLEGAPRLSTR